MEEVGREGARERGERGQGCGRNEENATRHSSCMN